MNTKKYIISVALVTSIFAGISSLALAETTIGATANVSSSMMPAKKMVLEIGPEGKTLLRGTISAVGTNSLTVKSWGGDWVINIASSTKLMPKTDMTQFSVGDFVGVQGLANQNSVWAIDASTVRNWTTRNEIQMNKKEIKDVMKAEVAKNWQGVISNIDAGTRSFTLTVDDKAYVVNLTSDAKIVNQRFVAIVLSQVKNGDIVRVWGPVAGTVITASVMRDTMIGLGAGL